MEGLRIALQRSEAAGPGRDPNRCVPGQRRHQRCRDRGRDDLYAHLLCWPPPDRCGGDLNVRYRHSNELVPGDGETRISIVLSESQGGINMEREVAKTL